jgi:hypothetical protein
VGPLQIGAALVLSLFVLSFWNAVFYAIAVFLIASLGFTLTMLLLGGLLDLIGIDHRRAHAKGFNWLVLSVNGAQIVAVSAWFALTLLPVGAVVAALHVWSVRQYYRDKVEQGATLPWMD